MNIFVSNGLLNAIIPITQKFAGLKILYINIVFGAYKQRLVVFTDLIIINYYLTSKLINCL